MGSVIIVSGRPWLDDPWLNDRTFPRRSLRPDPELNRQTNIHRPASKNQVWLSYHYDRRQEITYIYHS